MSSDVNVIELTGGPGLAIRGADGPLRPFLLIHDLGEDSRVWDAVAERLYAAGHQVVAVDLRGHGRSQAPDAGYDTDTCADDLATLFDQLGFTGGRAPIVVGHGWGANVAMSLAARRDGVAGVFCLDGGWIRPAWRYRSFEECWTAFAPTDDDTVLDADHRRSIVRSLFFGEPRGWYPLVAVPVVLCPVVPPDGRADPTGRGAAARTGIAEATARLPRSRVSWYYGEGDAIGTDPAKLIDDLLALAAAAEPQIN